MTGYRTLDIELWGPESTPTATAELSSSRSCSAWAAEDVGVVTM